MVTGPQGYSGSLTARGSGRPDFSIDQIRRLGTVGARELIVTGQWSNRHIAVGSTYVGSWIDERARFMKTVQALSTLGGSLHTIVGMTGTGSSGFTGTYNSQELGAGTMHLVSTREAFGYMRTIVVAGSVGSGKGTLSVSLARYA